MIITRRSLLEIMIITKIKGGHCPRCMNQDLEGYVDSSTNNRVCHCLKCDNIFEVNPVSRQIKYGSKQDRPVKTN